MHEIVRHAASELDPSRLDREGPAQVLIDSSAVLRVVRHLDSLVMVFKEDAGRVVIKDRRNASLVAFERRTSDQDRDFWQTVNAEAWLRLYRFKQTGGIIVDLETIKEHQQGNPKFLVGHELPQGWSYVWRKEGSTVGIARKRKN